MRTFKFSVFLFAVSFIFLIPNLANAAASVKAGEKLFKKFCVSCHGEKGKGDGSNADNMDPPPRDITDHGEKPYMVKRTVEELFKSINEGGSGIEKSPLMPAFGKTLSEEEIWSVIAYITTLYKPTNPGVDLGKSWNSERPKVTINVPKIDPPDRRAAMRGKRVYGKFGCSGCHKVKGRGGSSGPDLTGIAKKLTPEQLFTVTQNARAVNPDSVMPVYGLSKESAVGITRFLMTLE